MSVSTLDLAVALMCLVGVVGTLFPILPGAFLVAGATILWGVVTGGSTGWTIVAIAVGVTAVTQVLKYAWAGRRMTRDGVPSWIIAVGGVGGIVGFFLIPVVGVIVGFVLGVYLAEVLRLKSVQGAWPTTVSAMKAAGIATLVELAGALIVSAAWAVAAFGIV